MHRVVFLGTPEFAVPGLEALIAQPDFDVVGVVTQPDRPAGRGRVMRPSAVKQAALAHDLPVFQPTTLRDEGAVAQLRGWEPTVMVVTAFGQILRLPVLEAAPYGCVNVHASLLPRWRGAAPIQYAIRAGDAETGVTIMVIDEGLDTGPMLVRQAIPIAPRETGATLHDRLAQLGAEMLPDALRGYLAGAITPQAQPEEGVRQARSIKKEAGAIDWTTAAIEIDRQVRAYDPWPGTYTFFEDERLKIIEGLPMPGETRPGAPGTLVAFEDGLAVITGEGLYALGTVQPAGKKRMPVGAFLAGRPDAIGRQFGVEP